MIAFGNLATNPAVFTQKTFHWVDTVSMTAGDHAVKFGGEVRHIRDDSDFAVQRGGFAFFSIHDFAQDEASRVTNMGINPRHRADRAQRPELPVLGVRLLPAGRLEDPVAT